MKRTTTFSFFDVTVWGLVVYLALYLPYIEMRVPDDMRMEQPAAKEQPPTTAPPEQTEQVLNLEKCFHQPRSQCPPKHCKTVPPHGLFCCDLDSLQMKEILPPLLSEEQETIANKTTKYLHVMNATIDDLNVSQAMYKRLASMAFTDGKIGRIIGQFPKNSAMACLNISNNNLTSDQLQPLIERPFAYLFNLTVLDASSNNLTLLPFSLVQSNRNISVDLSGNNYLPCKHFQKAMESNNISKVQFLNYADTYCALDLRVSTWIKDTQIVPIDHLRVQKELNASCANIKPDNINCTCVPERLERTRDEVTGLVAVDCSRRHLKEMPTNLPPNTVKLNVSYNNITSLEPVSSDPTYDHVRQLFLDYNDIPNILELEGTKFIDNFFYFSIAHNKLKTIHTYVLSNRIDTKGHGFSIAGNRIQCNCITEKMLKPWLLENSKNIPDYKMLMCENMGAVVDLIESHVCHTPRDWTDYIYYIIGLEVLILVLLISKVSYDYWVFKTAGYLPWPANKMPRLPCDWLCE